MFIDKYVYFKSDEEMPKRRWLIIYPKGRVYYANAPSVGKCTVAFRRPLGKPKGKRR